MRPSAPVTAAEPSGPEIVWGPAAWSVQSTGSASPPKGLSTVLCRVNVAGISEFTTVQLRI